MKTTDIFEASIIEKKLDIFRDVHINETSLFIIHHNGFAFVFNNVKSDHKPLGVKIFDEVSGQLLAVFNQGLARINEDVIKHTLNELNTINDKYKQKKNEA